MGQNATTAHQAAIISTIVMPTMRLGFGTKNSK